MASRGRRTSGPNRSNYHKPSKSQQKVDDSSPVIQAFYGFQGELDARHDKYERIVKISRDITIESKRAIFLLQRCAGNPDQDEVLAQALTKIKEIRQTKFFPLAEELVGEDHYQFIRAYSPGLQEYIEAVSFHHYLQKGQLVSLSTVLQDLKFSRQALSAQASSTKASSANLSDSEKTANGNAAPSSASSSVKGDDESEEECAAKRRRAETGSGADCLVVTVPPMEFMLGIADLTGELMRAAIMSVSAGNLDFPIRACEFMRIIHDAFMSYGNTARELSKKMWTLQQSLQKVENACYTLRVRGSEIPKHMLADVFSGSSTEGFYADTDDAPADHM